MVELSICCIIKNEIDQIKRICKEWKHPKIELVIVDTGSNDGTIEFLKESKIHFYSFEWCNDFSKARNFSLSKAKGEMILWLDADDYLSEANKLKILELVSKKKDKAYKLIFKNPMDEGEGQVFSQTRLFPNFKNIEFVGRIHEELSTSLKKQNIPLINCEIEIEHRGYLKASDRLNKTLRNHQILLEQIKENPNDSFCLLELGNTNYQLKDYSKSVEYYIRALKLRSNSRGSALDSLEMLIGQVFLKLGDINRAKDFFECSIARSPEYLGAYYELAKLSLNKGDFLRAKHLFKELISQKEEVQSMAESKESLRLNSYGYLGLLAFGEKDFLKALAYFEKAYSSRWGLCVDPWLILESSYQLKDLNNARTWQDQLKLTANNEVQKEILTWLLPLKNEVEISRDDIEYLLLNLSKSLNNHDLWKQLKLVTNKFDNWERCLQRLSSFTKKDLFEIKQISQRILNGQSIPR